MVKIMTFEIKYLTVNTKEIEDCKECPYFEIWENCQKEYVCEVEFFEHYYDGYSIDDLLKNCPFIKNMVD